MQPAWSNDISGWDTNARSTRIDINIGRCVYSNTCIGSYQSVPVSSVLYYYISLLPILIISSECIFLDFVLYELFDSFLLLFLLQMKRLK